jgi:hypothetical protein
VRLLGNGVGLALTLLLIVLVVAVPLLFVQRSECSREGRTSDRWDLIAPWSEAPANCRSTKSGLRVLWEESGLG